MVEDVTTNPSASLRLIQSNLCDECRPNLLENVDFPGTDITSLYSPDVNHCQQLCTQHPSCLFFTFIRSDWTRDDRHFYCYLKHTSSGEPRTQTSLLGVTSGYSLKPCTSNTDQCFSTVYQNMDFLGADYQFLFTADYEECQRACTHDPACQFFTFANGDFSDTKIRHKCHLKFSWTVPHTPTVVERAGVVSGFSHKIRTSLNDGPVCQAKFFPNTDIPASDLVRMPSPSAEHCHTLCSAHPSCTYFSFSRNTCYLKKNVDQMVTVAKDGVTSGIPSRFCLADNGWVKVAHEGLDFAGSDIRYVLLDDADSCQRTCTEDPNCQFYTYATEDFFDSDYWRRCYLKRVISIPSPPKVTKLNGVVSGFTLRSCAV
ncbi:coagulation factor XI-like [Sphaeramia orbicularis]|uniref:coagulation factor XI-like n=1 Tax=Sphaeramia orbicularis TaxID=375764 RepID=UPI00117DAE62|nr:coagulation factor XI-like [Sphaeramia orbicularis]